MNIYYIGKFKKHFKQRIKPKENLYKKFTERLTLFRVYRNDPILLDHPLKGKKQPLRSFSITGDIRVIYFIKDSDAYFVDIGSHNQVYK